MCGESTAIEHSQRLQNLDRAHAALGDRIVVLLLRLRNVNQQRNTVPVGERARGAQRFVGVGVERVRRHGRDDQRIALKAADEALREGQCVLGVFASGAGKLRIVSPSTPRRPASLAASATTSSK